MTATGTNLNYFLDNKINKAEILFPGVGCFLIAVCLGSAVHASNAADNRAKLCNFSNDCKTGEGYNSFFFYFTLFFFLIICSENKSLVFNFLMNIKSQIRKTTSMFIVGAHIITVGILFLRWVGSRLHAFRFTITASKFHQVIEKVPFLFCRRP